jgi:hypothetical protein
MEFHAGGKIDMQAAEEFAAALAAARLRENEHAGHGETMHHELRLAAWADETVLGNGQEIEHGPGNRRKLRE